MGIPFWIYFLPTIFSFVFDCMRAQYLFNTEPTPSSTGQDGETDIDDEAIKKEKEKRMESAQDFASKGCASCCYLLVFFTIIIVGVCRLQETQSGNEGFSTFFVFLPIYIIVGILLCIMSCMIYCVPSEEELDEMAKELYQSDKYDPNFDKDQSQTMNNVESGGNLSSNTPEDTIPLKSSTFHNPDKSYNTITKSGTDLSLLEENKNNQEIILGDEEKGKSTSPDSDVGDIDE